MLMLMGSFPLDNHGLCKCRDSNVLGVESWQRKLKLKLSLGFGEFHLGKVEHFPLSLQPVANVVASGTAAPLEQFKRTRLDTIQKVIHLLQQRVRLVCALNFLYVYWGHFHLLSKLGVNLLLFRTLGQ